MKKLVLLVTLTLTTLVSSSFAELGDTLTQSCTHLGRPVAHNGNTYSFNRGKWFIAEWLSPAIGKVQAIEYILREEDTKITKAEYAELVGANVPKSYADDSYWDTRAPRLDAINDNLFNSVESKDGVYFLQYGKTFMDDKRQHFLAYVLVGFKAYKDEVATEWHTDRDFN